MPLEIRELIIRTQIVTADPAPNGQPDGQHKSIDSRAGGVGAQSN